MDRLTKKFNGEYYHKDANTIMFNSETDYNAIQKLGKIEDLMDEYNIHSVEELSQVLEEHRKSGETLYFCNRCGCQSLRESDRYCPECGGRVDD
jgi:rubrerythrin